MTSGEEKGRGVQTKKRNIPLRQSAYSVASAISKCPVQLGFQRHTSSCCGQSCPTTQLPTQCHEPCVQVLSRVVSQMPVSLPQLSHLFSADCSVHWCDRGAVWVSEQAFHFASCQLLFAPAGLFHKGFFDLFAHSLEQKGVS